MDEYTGEVSPFYTKPQRKPALPIVGVSLGTVGIWFCYTPGFPAAVGMAALVAGLTLGIVALARGRQDAAGKALAI